MTFFSTEAELALMAPDDGMGHFYPSSTCQSPPSIMYSPPLHHMTHRPQTTMPGNGGMYTPPQEFRPIMDSPYPPHMWSSQPQSMSMAPAPSYSYPPFTAMTSPPTLTHAHDTTLLPQYPVTRPSRSHSTSSSVGHGFASSVISERSPPPLSRSISPSSPDLRAYGIPNKNGTWRCGYSGCTSRAVFTRGCDLRKHHKRHTKSFFCRHGDCPQSHGGGFSSKKDLARHEAKHNPGVLCDWEGCDRVFSRVDNMVSSSILSEHKGMLLTLYTEGPCQEDPSQGFSEVVHNIIRIKPKIHAVAFAFARRASSIAGSELIPLSGKPATFLVALRQATHTAEPWRPTSRPRRRQAILALAPFTFV